LDHIFDLLGIVEYYQQNKKEQITIKFCFYYKRKNKSKLHIKRNTLSLCSTNNHESCETSFGFGLDTWISSHDGRFDRKTTVITQNYM
jgi:hypothetical protein